MHEDTSKFIFAIRNSLLKEKTNAMNMLHNLEEKQNIKRNYISSQIKAIEQREQRLKAALLSTNQRLDALIKSSESLKNERHRKRIHLAHLRNLSAGLDEAKKEYQILKEKTELLQKKKHEKEIIASKLSEQMRILQARLNRARNSLLVMRNSQIIPLQRDIEKLKKIKRMKEATKREAEKLAPQIKPLFKRIADLNLQEKSLMHKREEILKLKRELISAHSRKVMLKKKLNEIIIRLKLQENKLKKADI